MEQSRPSASTMVAKKEGIERAAISQTMVMKEDEGLNVGGASFTTEGGGNIEGRSGVQVEEFATPPPIIRSAPSGPDHEANQISSEGSSGSQATSGVTQGVNVTGQLNNETTISTSDPPREKIQQPWTKVDRRSDNRRKRINQQTRQYIKFDQLFKSSEPYYIKYFMIRFPGADIDSDLNIIQLTSD